MNRLPLSKRTQIIHLLVEGMSLRAISRIVDCSINTVTNILIEVGTACADYQDKHFRNLDCERLELDEIWSFVYAKQKHITRTMREKCDREGIGQIGDMWVWVALCAHSKLVPSWYVGKRTAASAEKLVNDLKSRLKKRVQITTDGFKTYVEAIDKAFGKAVDFAQLVKIYGPEPEQAKRYSPPAYEGSIVEVISGHPLGQYVSTSYAERQNLTMRMSMRRFTRLTNAFSKKADNHEHAVALNFMHYNFARIHKSLRVTPAQEIGITHKLWSIEDIARLG